MDGRAISFGPYRLLTAQRLLLEGDERVRLGGRAFDILTALVERAGKVVSKEELIARAWPTTTVEEASLTIQVSALRRALGDGQGLNRYIATVVGRGYNFVARIREEEPSQASPPQSIARTVLHNLPFAITRMIGREEIVTTLVAQLSRQRLVTIVGPGGIGKTTVALAVAERMIGSYEDGVWLVDLAPLRDPSLVPSAVAGVLGLEIRTENPLPALVAALKNNRMLLLLDNCEHVIDAAADLAEALLSGTSNVNILATSREQLRVSGEGQYRLRPLNSPGPSSTPSVAEAMSFPAVQLFVQRVIAVAEDFALTDANAPRVVEICRRLDGLPLAIEFAAPAVALLGVDNLAARLDSTLSLLSAGRRTSSPRHQTMRAVIDWSYSLLSPREQRLLQTLGVFSGDFTIEAATAVSAEDGETQIDILNCLVDLVAKSLVVADVSGTQSRFRLLGTTSVYASEKLHESGEQDQISRRQAEHYHELFGRAESEALTRPANEWLTDYAREIDNLRSALDWAFLQNGDASIGVALTAAAVPLWTRLSLLLECRSRVERALAALPPGSADARHEMKLQAALGASLNFTGGTVREILIAWTTALDRAERVGDVDYQLRALFGLWTHETKLALAYARQFAALAVTPADRLVGERMVGISSFHRGEHSDARRHLERVIAEGSAHHSGSSIRFQFDEQLVARTFLALILWLQGFPNQATQMSEDAVERARAADHPNSLCQALARAGCPVALWVGDLELAERNIELLRDHSTRHGLTGWRAYHRTYQGLLLIKRGDLLDGIALLRIGFDELDAAFSSWGISMFLGELADALGRTGQSAEALAVVDEAIERSGRTEEGWIIPELLRIKAELLLQQGEQGSGTVAEDHYRQAIDRSRRQGALSWELRAATSAARRLRDEGRHVDAISRLESVYDRFTEGVGTADLIAAKRLLDEMGDAAGN